MQRRLLRTGLRTGYDASGGTRLLSIRQLVDKVLAAYPSCPRLEHRLWDKLRVAALRNEDLPSSELNWELAGESEGHSCD